MPTQSTLKFTTQTMQYADFGEQSPVPSILTQFNVQNETNFFLDEYDEIYEGYGQLPTGFPYRKYTSYKRELHAKEIKVAILENEYLRAVFLPEFGGRLWQLTDKTSARELLYKNDVLRASNLAVRDAWFSGGVEWNIGVIGHTPLTCDDVFAAEATTSEGEPMLRLYAFERIRKVTYQMDFWLDKAAPLLNCRMRIVNENKELVPMYWWSNIAVEEYKNGRIFVPASSAYTSSPTGVRKAEIPVVNGVDISHYCDIPEQIDYFFRIPKTAPKFIANVDESGYGLLHVSSSQLQSRKLFSWGKSAGAARWQGFLTENAGRYLEIQAGLAKTQYGCIPMAPNTTWEWTEQYGPIQLTKGQLAQDFANVSADISKQILETRDLDKLLEETRCMAKTSAVVLHRGNADAILENAIRAEKGLAALCPHLDFSADCEGQSEWLNFIITGRLNPPLGDCPPAYYIWDKTLHQRLLNASKNHETDNWYVNYHLGLGWWQEGDIERATTAFQIAMAQSENPWTAHVMALMSLRVGDKSSAVLFIQKGISLRADDLMYFKEALLILEHAEAWQASCDAILSCKKELFCAARIQFYYATALHKLGKNSEAMAVLEQGGGLVVDDIRECDNSIGILWRAINTALTGDSTVPIPQVFNFATRAV